MHGSDLDAVAVVAAAQSQRAQLKNPPIDVDRYLEILFQQGLIQTTKALSFHSLIPIPCWDYIPQHGIGVFPIARSSHTMKNAINDVEYTVVAMIYHNKINILQQTFTPTRL
ncbi:hypothetical protein [Serratia proteamaculans]|uniref:hypothetical protein n=1 Tax=Serratia proteamaculans TaxID=28151 RepID=UPI0024B9AE83|nr:hypothetical protein [Serratia proteamaculans]